MKPLSYEHHNQDARQILGEALFDALGGEPTACLRKRMQHEEMQRQGRLGDKRPD
jgi:hypothetical protein